MNKEEREEMSDEEAILTLAAKMKDNVPSQEDKSNVHTFLQKVAEADDNIKTANLREDKEINEMGIPRFHVRGLLHLRRISGIIMNNPFFEKYFSEEIQDVSASSLSRGGFLIRQATTQTKQVADATRRVTRNKGLFGKEKVEEQGGDLFSPKT